MVTALAGQRIDEADALVAAVRSHAPGQQVKLTYSRGGNSTTVTLTLGESANDPWADLPVVQVLGAGYTRFKMVDFVSTVVADVDADAVVPFLLKGRYDSNLRSRPSRHFAGGVK